MAKREKSVLYNITCLGETLVPLPTFNLLNQSLKKWGGGVFQYDKPSRAIPTCFTPIVLLCHFNNIKVKNFPEKEISIIFSCFFQASIIDELLSLAKEPLKRGAQVNEISHPVWIIRIIGLVLGFDSLGFRFRVKGLGFQV